jgi:hypothetical protein
MLYEIIRAHASVPPRLRVTVFRLIRHITPSPADFATYNSKPSVSPLQDPLH